MEKASLVKLDMFSVFLRTLMLVTYKISYILTRFFLFLYKLQTTTKMIHSTLGLFRAPQLSEASTWRCFVEVLVVENDNGDRLCQWRWLALTPVALSVLLFSFLVFLPFFFSEISSIYIKFHFFGDIFRNGVSRGMNERVQNLVWYLGFHRFWSHT